MTDGCNLVAIGQICSTSSSLENLRQCTDLVKRAASSGAKVLFLPEAADFLAPSPSESNALARHPDNAAFVQGLQAAAKEGKIAVNVGVHEPGSTGGRVRNMSLWIDEHGEIVQRYQKMHLFDMQATKSGETSVKESASVEPGDQMTAPFKTSIGSVGLMICFDLRFPALSSALRKAGAQLLAAPSAWATETGRAGHWEALLKARAIENQCYVIAAAQVGQHEGGRSSYGQSMIIDPWGIVVVRLGGLQEWEDGGRQSEFVTAELDLTKVQTVRERMPLA